MALRLIDIYLPSEKSQQVQDALEVRCIYNSWINHLIDNQMVMRVLIPSEETEPILDILQKQFCMIEGFRAFVLDVEAAIPRPEAEKKAVDAEAEQIEAEQKPATSLSRISREELYADVVETTKLTRVFILLVILSSIVAAIGMMRNNVAAIIGAMVIAPLLGPNVALSLATTLGDIDLSSRALRSNAVGLLTGLFFAALIGVFFGFDPTIPEIYSRTEVSLSDIVLALAAGGAASLSFTTAVPSALIGVMVAVALLPPLVCLGMLMGGGYWQLAFGSFLLLLTNLICINLAGVMSFMAQGIRPVRWWEANRAKKASHIAITIWSSLLILLAIVIVISKSKP